MRKSWYRSRGALVWGGVAVVALVGVVALFAFGPNKDAAPEVFNDDPVKVPVVQKKAPLPEEAKQVAIRFVQTAVARENLEEAWELVGPNLRGGLTRKEWISGDNPVVPYPIDQLDGRAVQDRRIVRRQRAARSGAAAEGRRGRQEPDLLSRPEACRQGRERPLAR